jgi:hypothetical protein
MLESILKFKVLAHPAKRDCRIPQIFKAPRGVLEAGAGAHTPLSFITFLAPRML